MYSLECLNRDTNRQSSYYLKPNKSTSVGRKTSDIRFDNKFISRNSHFTIDASAVDTNKRDDINAKYTLTLNAIKRVKLINDADNKVHTVEARSTELNDGDVLLIGSDAIKMTVRWNPIFFNVSPLFPSKASFNSETLKYAQLGLKLGRGYWSNTYNFLVQPTRSINAKVLGALTDTKPIVNGKYLENVYQAILSDNLEHILPTVTSDYLPAPVSSDKLQKDTFWLVSENRLALFIDTCFILLLDDKQSTYIDILSSCGATIQSLNIKSTSAGDLELGVSQILEQQQVDKTIMLLPPDVNDRMQDNAETWWNKITQVVKKLGIRYVEPASLDTTIMQIDMDCLKFTKPTKEEELQETSSSLPPRESGQPLGPTSEHANVQSSIREPERTPLRESPPQPLAENSRKRKASKDPDEPQKRLIRRAGGKRAQRVDLDDDIVDVSVEPSKPSTTMQDQPQAEPSEPPQQPVAATPMRRRTGNRRSRSINIDESDDERPPVQETIPEVIREIPDTVSQQSPEVGPQVFHLACSRISKVSPPQQRSTLRRRANTRKMQTINIDDSDEEPFPAPQPTQAQPVSSEKPRSSAMKPEQSQAVKRTPEPVEKRRTARERVEEQMQAKLEPGRDFLAEHIDKRKKTLLDERQKNMAAQEMRKAEQEALLSAQKEASKQPEKTRSRPIKRSSRDDFDDDIPNTNNGTSRPLNDCLIPMKLIPLHRRDRPAIGEESGTKNAQNFKKFKRKIDHRHQPRVEVGLRDRHTQIRPRPRKESKMTIEMSSDEDELFGDEYLDDEF
ncbi:hypothetical protein E3Q19_01282 [Wallemia mellicola]|nr:hypothetical protein E3Q19_01282 [Wallemia mellicola]